MNCDGAIRNIEKEILRECANKGIQIHATFLNYYLKLLTLDPTWGITDKNVVDRDDVQRFIEYVVSKIENQGTPGMIALKMQFYFNCNFQQKFKIVKKNRSELLERLQPLEQEIIEIKALNEEEDYNVMYGKIVYYVTLASGLGNPSQEPVFKEVKAALGSILDKNELKDFVGQPRYTKIENLMEFSKLVTGIRLFNKDCGKGGEGMEDLPRLINEALDATAAELQKSLISVMDKVNLMTTALDFVYVTELNERGNYVVICRPTKGLTVENVDYVKESLVVYRQVELYIRKLIDEVERIEDLSSQIFSTFQRALIELHRVVIHRIAIPVNQVFPHFLKLAEIWSSLQDQTVLLAKVNQMLSNLYKYLKVLSFSDSTAEVMIPPGESVMTDAERLQRRQGEKIPIVNINARVIDSVNYKDITKIKLEFLGFCAWKLVMTEGALLPGNPNLGVIKVMNLNFVLSSLEAGIAFGKTPEKCIMESINLARRKPELINLLNVKNRLVLLQNIRELVREPPELPLTTEVEVQTVDHPIPSYIDENYLWNVWDLKRKAILYANLSHCKTHSSQTLRSYHRSNFKLQTTSLKEQSQQTMRDNSTNVRKPSTYLFGLRGRKDDKQFVLNVTKPVEK